MTFPCPALVVLDSWAGRSRYLITLVGETPTRYRVRLDSPIIRLRTRTHHKGDVFLVPKRAVVIGDPNAGVSV